MNTFIFCVYMNFPLMLQVGFTEMDNKHQQSEKGCDALSVLPSSFLLKVDSLTASSMLVSVFFVFSLEFVHRKMMASLFFFQAATAPCSLSSQR